MTVVMKDLDYEALKEKYAEERAKRLRPDGNDQFVSLAAEGKFARLLDDPFAPEPTPRDPVRKDVEVLIVGAGMSGLMTATHLSRQGVDDYLIVDPAADIGGTWYWCRHPGIRCDTESYVYMPFLEDLGNLPSEKYASGEEIRGQMQAAARKYGVYHHALFRTTVKELAWSEPASRWIVRTDRGDEIAARYAVLAVGRLHRPKLPGIPGIKRFKGHYFHTNRWDYAYTGGGPGGGMVNLRDKRVAIIGTGATAVQAVPHLARDAGELFVVQRTPTAVDIRNNSVTPKDWADGLEPGWQQARRIEFESVFLGAKPQVVYDQWHVVWGIPDLTGEESLEELGRILEQHDLNQMQRIRERIDSIVEDTQTADALKPYYYRYCKRPTFHDEYLQAFNKDNVRLLNTDGKGVEEITETGLVVAGQHYEMDCIIYSTGQELGVAPPRAGEFTVIGRNNRSLEEEWKDPSQVRTLHGIHARGFPNLMIDGQLYHTAACINLSSLFEEHGKHIAWLIKQFVDRDVEVAEITEDAEGSYCRLIRAKAPADNKACTPGEYNNEGQGTSLFTMVFGEGPPAYFTLLDDWRRSDPVERDFELVTSSDARHGVAAATRSS
jgi:cyclohexanone monooxygenase